MERAVEKQKIGILRTLYYYIHPGIWENFFSFLGYDPVLSDPTDEKTIEEAGRISEPEHCLPIKLFDAHFANLSDRVDIIFVPRILSAAKSHIACPKLGVLPDVAALSGSPKILTIDIDERNQDLKRSLMCLAKILKINKNKAKQAADRALKLMQQNKKPDKHQKTYKEKFLILGHPYMLYDEYFSGQIFRKLERLEVEVNPITYQDAGITENFIKWDTCGKMYNKIISLKPEDYYGIIQISAFNCGCDSIMLDIYRDEVMKIGIPYLILMIDEHTSTGGIVTRLEAFVDSVRWQNY